MKKKTKHSAIIRSNTTKLKIMLFSMSHSPADHSNRRMLYI